MGAIYAISGLLFEQSGSHLMQHCWRSWWVECRPCILSLFTVAYGKVSVKTQESPIPSNDLGSPKAHFYQEVARSECKTLVTDSTRKRNKNPETGTETGLIRSGND